MVETYELWRLRNSLLFTSGVSLTLYLVQEQEYFKSILEKIEQSLLVVERDKRCAYHSGFVQQTAVVVPHVVMQTSYKLTLHHRKCI